MEGLSRVLDIEEDVIKMAWSVWVFFFFLLIYHVITKANLIALIKLFDAMTF
jgi:phage shock protein PspC (stress-responsive transcriptional regulator)